MKKVVITFKVNEEERKLIDSIFLKTASTEFLKDFDKEEFDSVLNDADILFAWNPPRELKQTGKDSLKNIEFVQLLSAGYDHIDFDRFSDKCKIASNKGAYAEPMAEHIVAMILSIYKNLFENHKKLASGEFNQKGVNRSLKDSTCTILGYGGIGKATAILLKV
jgi:phosphoglycerate dehydrogenase-like enzyme